MDDKSKKDKDSSSDEDQYGNYVTRCICGFTHNTDLMVCCDKCDVWQHTECLNLDDSNIPESYLCEQCNPRPVNVRRAIYLQTYDGDSDDPGSKQLPEPELPPDCRYTEINTLRLTDEAALVFNRPDIRSKLLMLSEWDHPEQASAVRVFFDRVASGFVGLFLGENVSKDEAIMEFAGDVSIRSPTQTWASCRPTTFVWHHKQSTISVDARHCGNLARFARRSCQPNCIIKPAKVGARPTFVLVATRRLCRGMELTVPFDVDLRVYRKHCFCACGSSACRIKPSKRKKRRKSSKSMSGQGEKESRASTPSENPQPNRRGRKKKRKTESQDFSKMSREERKIAAIMAQFERMEQQQTPPGTPTTTTPMPLNPSASRPRTPKTTRDPSTGGYAKRGRPRRVSTSGPKRGFKGRPKSVESKDGDASKSTPVTPSPLGQAHTSTSHRKRSYSMNGFTPASDTPFAEHSKDMKRFVMETFYSGKAGLVKLFSNPLVYVDPQVGQVMKADIVDHKMDKPILDMQFAEDVLPVKKKLLQSWRKTSESAGSEDVNVQLGNDTGPSKLIAPTNPISPLLTPSNSIPSSPAQHVPQSVGTTPIQSPFQPQISSLQLPQQPRPPIPPPIPPQFNPQFHPNFQFGNSQQTPPSSQTTHPPITPQAMTAPPQIAEHPSEPPKPSAEQAKPIKKRRKMSLADYLNKRKRAKSESDLSGSEAKPSPQSSPQRSLSVNQSMMPPVSEEKLEQVKPSTPQSQSAQTPASDNRKLSSVENPVPVATVKKQPSETKPPVVLKRSAPKASVVSRNIPGRPPISSFPSRPTQKRNFSPTLGAGQSNSKPVPQHQTTRKLPVRPTNAPPLPRSSSLQGTTNLASKLSSQESTLQRRRSSDSTPVSMEVETSSTKSSQGDNSPLYEPDDADDDEEVTKVMTQPNKLPPPLPPPPRASSLKSPTLPPPPKPKTVESARPKTMTSPPPLPDAPKLTRTSSTESIGSSNALKNVVITTKIETPKPKTMPVRKPIVEDKPQTTNGPRYSHNFGTDAHQTRNAGYDNKGYQRRNTRTVFNPRGRPDFRERPPGRTWDNRGAPGERFEPPYSRYQRPNSPQFRDDSPSMPPRFRERSPPRRPYERVPPPPPQGQRRFSPPPYDSWRRRDFDERPPASPPWQRRRSTNRWSPDPYDRR